MSLGGYYAARVAGGDERVKATISLCPVYCLGDIWDRLPDLSRAAFTVRSKSESADQARRRAGELTMADRAGLIRGADPDRCRQARPDLSLARRRSGWPAEIGPHAESLLLEDGNHGCANVVYLHRPYSADWMAAKLAE